MKTIRFDESDREGLLTPHDAWMAARRGRITGSRIDKIYSTAGVTKEAIVNYIQEHKIAFGDSPIAPDFKKLKKEEIEALVGPTILADLRARAPKKLEFYAVIAEKLGMPPEQDENPMERGHLLEKDAIDRFTKETGIEVDTSLKIWTRDEDENIAVSPDGTIGETEAVEVKCLSSAKHLKAYIEQAIPDDYLLQALQYFVVNDQLEVLHFVLFDPRFSMNPDLKNVDFFEIRLTREKAEAEIEKVAAMLAYEREIMAQVNYWVNKLSL